MTEHGMQRFDDFKETVPEIYRPDLLDKASMWVLQKVRPKYTIRELVPSTPGFCKGGIELRPVGKNSSGLFIRINADRSNPQKCVYEKCGKVSHGNLPAFFTESELIGVIEHSSRQIDNKNTNILKSKSQK
jgi:hypothetical protein